MEGRAAQLIRAAVADDVALLGPIEVAAGERFREIGMDDIADDDPPPADVLAAAVDDGRVWVAEVDGEVVGYAWALDLDGQAHLEQVSVVPAHSGTGLGRALVDTVAEWANAIGSPSLTLSTFRDVPWNAPLYAHLGFVPLEGAELDAALLAVVAEEAAHGLDVSRRVVMARPLR